jgi:hypothetical protein
MAVAGIMAGAAIVGTAASYIGGAVSSFATNKYYLEQQLIPMQVYMDDIETFMQYLPASHKCRLKSIERDYRINMRLDSYVRIKMAPKKYALFKNLRMEFKRNEKMTQQIQNIIGKTVRQNVSVCISLRPNDLYHNGSIQFTIRQYEDISMTRLTAAYYNNPRDTSKKYALYCYDEKNVELWVQDYNTLSEISTILQPLQLSKHLERVFVQTYNTEKDEQKFGDFSKTSDEDVFKWVPANCVYRGVYRPLSPLRCSSVQVFQIRAKELNNNGWNSEALKSVVNAWLNIEYLYLALKSMFEEIRTLVGLEIKDNILHRQLDTLMNKIDHGASADHVQGSARNPQLANFKTYVLKF